MSSNYLVIKVGGALLDNPAATLQLLQTIAQLQQAYSVVLVHGGGQLVQEQLNLNGFESKKHNGLRISPKAQMPIISGALAGNANKQLLAVADGVGIKACGLCLSDAQMTQVSQLDAVLEQVGNVTPNDDSLLRYLLAANTLPIISSIAAQGGELWNVNADDAASCIAQLLGAQLVLLSDVPGVLDGDKNLIETLTLAQINALIADDVISGGMQVKVQAAHQVSMQLGQTVYIAGWKNSQALAGLLTGQPIGTAILPEGK